MIQESPSEAARAAARRAQACRARCEELRQGRKHTLVDVARAEAALALARERAAAAATRHIRVSTAALVGSTGRPWPAPVEPAWPAAYERLRRHGVSFDAINEAYLVIGGSSSRFEVDAFLHGAADLPPTERLILTHVLWELDDFAD